MGNVSTSSGSDRRERTPLEAAGYLLGTLTGIAQAVMPVRMWITLIASGMLMSSVYHSESLLDIARALTKFVVLMAILIGSAVFCERSRE
ncbi:MAG: hypothetical protein KDN22_13650 [Verrucomicrobiae bacterium]|nr:hypothetical protein [Verrucomicrobiae bacterium]